MYATHWQHSKWTPPCILLVITNGHLAIGERQLSEQPPCEVLLETSRSVSMVILVVG